MAAKPIFTEEQHEILHTALLRVWNRYKREGKTQADLAQELGITQQTVSTFIKGTYRPSIRVATDVALLDGKTLEELVGDYGRPSAYPGSHAPKGVDASEYPNLDACVRFFVANKTWSPWTLAAARAGFFGPSDHEPPQWAEKLDVLEKVLERARRTSESGRP